MHLHLGDFLPDVSADLLTYVSADLPLLVAGGRLLGYDPVPRAVSLDIPAPIPGLAQ